MSVRILVCADVPPDPNSGAAGTEYQTIHALRKLGHEVDEIWADSLPHKIQHGNLHYLLELPKGFRDTIRRKWTANTYDVVHVNQPHAYLAAIDHKKSKRPGVFVNRSHGIELRVQYVLRPWRKKFGICEWRFPRNIIGRLIQHLLNRHSHLVAEFANGTIVSCNECKNFLIEKHNVAPDKVACIPQAPPLIFQNTEYKPISFKRLKKLLYVGQFAFFKGPMVLAASINKIMSADQRCKFTWVCNKEHHEKARKLLSVVAKRRTSFLDWQDQNNLMHIFDEHGIFIFPSLFEGFGKVFLEAMSRGLCVIASDIGGMRDVITSGHNGYLVPSGDTEAFARIALKIMYNPNRLKEIGEKARQVALTYTWERVANETLEFYMNLLEMNKIQHTPL